MQDSAVETTPQLKVPSLKSLLDAGLTKEKAQAILEKKSIAAQNIVQAKLAGSELYERVSLGLPVTELKLGSGILQLNIESPTTGNLTEIIKNGLDGLNPNPPEDEEMAIYDGIASKALKEKDYLAAAKALRLAENDPKLEKPEVKKRLQDATDGDEEEQYKLAEVLDEIFPENQNSQPSIIEPAKASATPDLHETSLPKTAVPSSIPTKSPTATTAEPKTPDLTGYNLPPTSSQGSNISATPGLTLLGHTPIETAAPTLNIAGARPIAPVDNLVPPSQIEVTANPTPDQSQSGLRLVPPLERAA